MDGSRPAIQRLIYSTSGMLGGLGHSRESSCGGNSSRSISLASISSEGSTESPLVEQEEIAALTHDVRNFKESLGKLRRIFNPERDRQETLRVAAHERLGDVLRILRTVLEKYPALQSSELLASAGTLIQEVKGYDYEDERLDPKIFFESIDQLALAFSSRVSEYLMGDLDPNVSLSSSMSSKTKSCENLASDVEGSNDVLEEKPRLLSAHQIDAMLLTLEQGVDFALVRAKLWAKYSKEIIHYIEKRIHLDLEYANNLGKLSLSVGPAVKEESNLPFQSIYCTALEQDLENSNASQRACSLLLSTKFVEPLSARRSEHERIRKIVKETWHRELNAMHQAVSRVRKARHTFARYQQDAMQVTSKDTHSHDKKKHEEEALQKIQAAETAYKECVVEVNERHIQLQRVKTDVVQQIRELILQSDQVMKTVTVAYFQLQHSLNSPLPIQFQSLCDSSRLYEPGSQYMEFVKRLPPPPPPPPPMPPPPANWEHQQGSWLMDTSSTGHSRLGHLEQRSSYYVNSEELFTGKGKRLGDSIKAWRCSEPFHGSDTDSIPSSPSSKSHDNSPTNSPKSARRQISGALSADELDTATETMFSSATQECISKASESHSFRHLKTPSRCRECDSYVYFQGLDCTECGLTCHKKCLGTLAILCGHKRLAARMTTFGVDLGQHLAETAATIPYLIVKCIAEIEERGISLKGIYRLSGVKSKVEKLCQAFENGADLVELSDIHPNVIANVMKLYLRQLPEPLLTFRLYSEFIRVAKECPTNSATEVQVAIESMEELLRKLPRHNFNTLAILMHHLSAVSQAAAENNMPASNLGIVFGPTLLRTTEGSASLSCLSDTVHQTRIVELMISHVDALFSGTLLGRHHSSKQKGTATASIFEAEQAQAEKLSVLTTTEGASFLHMPSNFSAPGLESPQIFKGSLKDYQGLEGVSLKLLGNFPAGSREGTIQSADEKWENTETTVSGIPISPKHSSSLLEFHASEKKQQDRQSTESWSDSDYHFEWHGPRELEEVCQVFLEPPVLWNKKMQQEEATAIPKEVSPLRGSVEKSIYYDVFEDLEDLQEGTEQVASSSGTEPYDGSYIPMTKTPTLAEELPVGSSTRSTDLEIQDFTSLLKSHFIGLGEDVMVMPQNVMKSIASQEQTNYQSSKSETATVLATQTAGMVESITSLTMEVEPVVPSRQFAEKNKDVSTEFEKESSGPSVPRTEILHKIHLEET